MTTIAYKDGEVAYDSRICAGETILDDDFDKLVVSGDKLFFLAGFVGDFDDFIKHYNEGSCSDRELEVSAIVVDQGAVYSASTEIKGDKHHIWRFKIRLGSSYAIGSGRDFALAFMDSGMTAAEAVSATTKRDSSTGGMIRTRQLP